MDVKTEDDKKPEPAPSGFSWGTFFAGVVSVVIGGLIVESVRQRRREQALGRAAPWAPEVQDELGGW